MKTLNELFSSPSTRRRYEVWFVRLGLADGSGAWWFRYLLMNLGRGGCPGNAQGMPAQVWATWFPANGKPETFIQGFSLDGLELSARNQHPFYFRTGENAIEENCCRGALAVNGHTLSWDMHYRSAFRTTLSDKGWIGFSRTPHSDALFSGHITLDGRRSEADPLGFGVQGHNCGYRHRNFWRWTHAYFLTGDRQPSTLEALAYEMPFGLIFRKAVLWYDGERHVIRNFREITKSQNPFKWDFNCRSREGLQLEITIDGTGPATHHLPYLKTDCSGSFDVMNNSLSSATVFLQRPNKALEKLETASGAVLEMAGLP